MNITLAIIYHDPQGRLYDQLVRILPRLIDIFSGVAVQASSATYPPSLEYFATMGASIQQEIASETAQKPKIGKARRDSLNLALKLDSAFILYCDADRVLHWAEQYPQELADVAIHLREYDFTVLGRTHRAFNTHPRNQCDTEAIVNYVFEIISGCRWDVTAAARGLSRRAAETILAKCPDEEISTDVSWPLFIQRHGNFSQGYLEAEGLEFETADRYPEEAEYAGSVAKWREQLDTNPQQWAVRLNMARLQVEAMMPYADGTA